MGKEFPGGACTEGLLHWTQSVERGEYTPPADGLLRLVKEGMECIVPLPLIVAVNRVGTSEGVGSPPLVEVKILIDPNEPWTIKAGKDAKGKSVFLRALDD